MAGGRKAISATSTGSLFEDAPGEVLPPARRSRKKPALSQAKALVPPVGPLNGEEAQVFTGFEAEALAEELSAKGLTRFEPLNEEEAKRYYTQSLQLFEEGGSILDSATDLLLKKSSVRVRYVRPLKLLQRQLHNILLFVARPTMSSQDVFAVSLDYLGWSVEHNHNDSSYLKSSVEEMQQSLMQVASGSRWFSTQILQDVFIDGKTLYYKIPPLLKRIYSAPEKYYHVSLTISARFKSKYAHALYELLREYLWRGQTGNLTLQEFRERMGVEDSEYPEFKRLVSRVITPAIAELEKASDYRAEVKYIRKGKFVVALNFSIYENPKNGLGLSGGVLDAERFRILREDLGVSGPNIRDLTKKYPLSRVEEVTDVLYCRYVLRKRLVRNGFALVTKALNDTEDNYFLTTAEREELIALREAARARPAIPEDAKAFLSSEPPVHRRFDAWWGALSPDQKEVFWGMFFDSLGEGVILKTLKLKKEVINAQHPMTQAAMASFASKIGAMRD